jgi:hypothetical protein
VSIRIPRWFGVPPELVDDGVALKMSESDLRLCVYAYRKCDKQSSRRFQSTDKEIAKTVGVSARALRDSRIHLRELGVLFASKEPGGRYTYELCDLHTGRPFPGDPKSKPAYVKRPTRADDNESRVTFPTPELRNKEVAPSSGAAHPSDTDFDYGHNVKHTSASINLENFNPFSDQ